MRSYKHRTKVALPTLTQILNLWNEGLNTAEIAIRLNVAESFVYNLLTRERE